MGLASPRQFMDYDSTFALPKAHGRAGGFVRGVIRKHSQKPASSLNQVFQARKINLELSLKTFIHEQGLTMRLDLERFSESKLGFC